MLHIFVSYSSKSRSIVQGLAEDLETAGHQVWFDRKLTGGQVWWDQILEQIRQCDLFIFALTPDAMDSHPCKLEYTYASELGKTVLPVLLADGVSVNLLPPPLTTIQFVDYRGGDKAAAFRLTNALSSLPAPKPLPD
ncbi:MAG TPA: toll/interleukin-1 receptor domain-containing protein, partial [Spirillospora sp.]|nr:toll/interleukin-1 receptor domain-containing protein [Spirillospora sp.]